MENFEFYNPCRILFGDGKLDRLRRRLEKIHKEELEDGYDTADVA